MIAIDIVRYQHRQSAYVRLVLILKHSIEYCCTTVDCSETRFFKMIEISLLQALLCYCIKTFSRLQSENAISYSLCIHSNFHCHSLQLDGRRQHFVCSGFRFRLLFLRHTISSRRAMFGKSCCTSVLLWNLKAVPLLSF